MDKFGLWPELDITENVNVMGDMYNQDTLYMKAYSSFEIQIDYYQLMYEGKKQVEDILEWLGRGNEVNFKSISAWPGPPDKTYHDARYDEMIEEFHEEYVGPFDQEYRQKLADYEDTIKQLIEIEKGGNFYEPPKIEGRDDFYQDIKSKALKQI